MSKLHNIFSSVPSKSSLPSCPNPNIPIVIDTREKQSLVAAELVSLHANVVFQKLDIGDYVIGGKVVERKTVSDFVSSMIDKRLSEQLVNLKKFDAPLLLLEGSRSLPSHSKLHPNAFSGMLLSVALDFKIPIIFTDDTSDTARQLLLIAKRQEKAPVKIALSHTKTAKTFLEQKRVVLESFPGVGPTLANRLLEDFGSLNKVFSASPKRLSCIKGFDTGKLDRFLRLLRD